MVLLLLEFREMQPSSFDGPASDYVSSLKHQYCRAGQTAAECWYVGSATARGTSVRSHPESSVKYVSTSQLATLTPFIAKG